MRRCRVRSNFPPLRPPGRGDVGYRVDIGRKSAQCGRPGCANDRHLSMDFSGPENWTWRPPDGAARSDGPPGVQPRAAPDPPPGRAPPSSLCSSDEEDRLEPAEYYGAGNGASGSWLCRNARRFLSRPGFAPLQRFLVDAGRFSGFSVCGRFWRAPVPWNGDLSRRWRNLRLNRRLTPGSPPSAGGYR